MPFTIQDFQDLVRLLEEHPEWRDGLRRQVLSAELLALPDLMHQIAETQLHTDQVLASVAVRLDALAEAQIRSEQRLARVEARQEQLDLHMGGVEARQEHLETRMAELVEAQIRTEEALRALTVRVDHLETRMAELVEAQIRTEEALRALTVRVDQRAGGLRRLQQEVGGLSEIAGASAEVEAERTLVAVLTEQGYQLLAAPGPVLVNGEVDVAAPVRDPGGRHFWVLLEARARLHRGDVRGWDRRLGDPGLLARLEAEGVAAPFLPFAFGLRVYRDAEEQGKACGIGILSPHGERVAATPRPA